MHVVILAAGQGQRLGKEDPKPLTLIDKNQSILGRQLKLLEKHLSPHQVRLVVGYKKEKIHSQLPGILTVESQDYQRQNTAKSLLLGIEGLDDDIVWLNGDVVFHPTVLKAIFSESRSAMVVDKGPVGEEEVKYCLGTNGNIAAVSKSLKSAEGEALGINRIQRDELPFLRQALENCDEQAYFEQGVEKAMAHGVQFWPVIVERKHCIEVDFPEDLARARALLKTWS